MNRIVILSLPEFALLRSMYSQGGCVSAEEGDLLSRATLLREGMVRVLGTHDMLTDRAFQFLERARVDSRKALAELDD